MVFIFKNSIVKTHALLLFFICESQEFPALYCSSLVLKYKSHLQMITLLPPLNKGFLKFKVQSHLYLAGPL